MKLLKSILPVFVFMGLLGTGKAQNMMFSELLGRPTDHSITIQAFFADSVEVSIQYGTNPGNYTSQSPWQAFSDSMPAEVVLSGLQADTRYFYRMNYRLPGSTNVIQRPEYTFQTQRPPGRPFSFVVEADPHLDGQSDSTLYKLCLQNQLEDQPDFMIDLGDIMMTDKLRNASNQVPHDTVPYRCKLFRSYYQRSCHSMPLFMALGNHEGEAGWYNLGQGNDMAIWDSQERKKYFPNPIPDNFYSGDTTNNPFVGVRENFYTWQWGDAQFIVLDPYWYTMAKPDSLHGWYWSLGKPQYDWLKRTLENSTAKFKFVFAHQIIGGDPEGRGGVEYADKYEWGGNNLDGTPGFAANRPGWYKPIRELLEENHVNIFFHGHDHFFGKQDLNCLVYQEVPQPSHPNFNSATYATAYGYVQGQILPNSGHMRVTVTDTVVKVEYVRAYLPQNENGTRHNKDVSATYYIPAFNCYDSLSMSTPVIWNSNYGEDIAYPNPFSHETVIPVDVPSKMPMRLVILDPLGRVVRTMLNGHTLEKGSYRLVWDGLDANNGQLPSGNYSYILTGNAGLLKTGKLVLIR